MHRDPRYIMPTDTFSLFHFILKPLENLTCLKEETEAASFTTFSAISFPERSGTQNSQTLFRSPTEFSFYVRFDRT